MIQKPLLAGKAPEDLTKLRFPLLVSPKLDGIRCLTLPPYLPGDTTHQPGRTCRAVSRKLKPIPNDHIRNLIETMLPPGCDGELLLPDWTAPFNEVSSAVMSKDGTPAFHFALFDYLDGDEPIAPFSEREGALQLLVQGLTDAGASWLWRVRHQKVESVEELLELHAQWLAQGFEGSMLRDPNGTYKFGRSTEREGILLKLKNFEDEEATVIGVVELMHNQNELCRDELGYAKRSTAKAGKVGAVMLGTLKCRFVDGSEFEVGTGFTEEQRLRLWRLHVTDVTVTCGGQGVEHIPGAVIGRTVKIRYQPPPGGRKPGEPPRFPVFLGFRHADDIGEAA